MASIITAIVYNKKHLFYLHLNFWLRCTYCHHCRFFFCCFKHHLVIEPTPYNNPLKLIWRVMRYALTHKQPVRSSAFTYGEIPDLIYVKRDMEDHLHCTSRGCQNFLYILSIVLGMCGYTIFDTKNKFLINT